MTNLNNEFDYSKTYYKVLRKDMTHRGFKYEMGLNVDTNEFNDNPEQKCVKGGLYFVNDCNIINFMNLGSYLAEIIIPEDAKVISLNNKYRADKIIIKSIIELYNVTALSYVINIQNTIDSALEVVWKLILKKDFDLAYDIYNLYNIANHTNCNRLLFKLMKDILYWHNQRQDAIEFMINKLDWFNYFDENQMCKDYKFMKKLRDSQEYSQINFIYDNNL